MHMRVAVLSLVMLGQAALGQTQDPLPKSLQRVFVHQTDSGDELEGRLLDLGPNSLAMIVDGRRVELPVEKVLRIEVPGDSLKNGALIGALVGGLWCALVCGQGLDSISHLPAAVGFSAAFWSAVGAGIDAAIPGRTMIYRKSSPRVGTPRDARAGVSFSFRF
jgi:hypothetical protein